MLLNGNRNWNIPVYECLIRLNYHSQPFISATDICTFRLYYNKTGSTKFAVYSTALSMYFVYELATNTITPTKDINFNSTPLSEKAAP